MNKIPMNVIDKVHKRTSTPIWYRSPSGILATLLLGLFLLSACSSGGMPTQPSTTDGTGITPTPTVDLALQKEGNTQLQAFQQWINLMQQYHGDVTVYQQQYTSDQRALHSATNNTAYKNALSALNAHVAAIRIPALKAESTSLFQELQQKATAFGQQHTYHDSYDNTTYPLGYEYGSNGAIGPLWLQGEMNAAQTLADYQQLIEDLNMNLTNFQAMAANFGDKTPYNQIHQTDIQLMQKNNLMNKKVIVVSLIEQAMRVYQNGKLVKAFLVTTGQPDLPSPPGDWWVEGKQSPTVFKPGPNVPPSSPEWYPPTPIHFAMLYHSHGYFLHDSWWRTQYGPGTNFPHLDAGGSQFSIHGSHGCVNLSQDDAGWLYGFVQLYTDIIIY